MSAESPGGGLTFVADDIRYEEAPDELTPGWHVFQLVNGGALRHTVTIEELDDRTVVEAEAGDADRRARARHVHLLLQRPRHRASGMGETLEVAG